MREDFDTILDKCLEQVMQGETDIDTCVAQYPERGEELKRLLGAALTFHELEAPKARPDASDAGKTQLLRALERKRVPSKALLDWFTALRHRRWAHAVMCLVALAAVLCTVALLSRSSLPGQPLYAVKKGVERISFATSLSAAGKADTRVAQVERRVEELALLVDDGDAEKMARLAQTVKSDLEEAVALGATLEGTEQAETFRDGLKRSASKSLSLLETSLTAAPAGIKPAVSDAFKTVSAGYAQAIEAATAKAPPQLVTGQGFLRLLTTDPPPPPLDNVFVQVDKIEAYLAAGDDSRWISVVDDTNAFDLLMVAQIHRYLGQQQMPAGSYTQIRFEIGRAVVVAGGEAHIAIVPGDKISFERPFEVVEGETTSVTIDFDGQRSVSVTDAGEFELDPVVTLLVDEPEEGTEDQDATPEPDDAQVVEITGLIQSISDTLWVVGSQSIIISPETAIEGTPEVGLMAEVLAAVETDGSFTAVSITVNGSTEETLGTTSFEGAIEVIGDEAWQVAGRTIIVTVDTRITGSPEVGLTARVEAQVEYDGTFTALSIEVVAESTEQDEGSTDVEIEGTVGDMDDDTWEVGGGTVNITPDTEVDGDPEEGSYVDVDGTLEPDGSITADQIDVYEDEVGDPDSIGIEATIEAIGTGTWTVGGRTISIASQTQIEGEPQVGYVASVKGTLQQDNSILALQIRIGVGVNRVKLEGPVESIEDDIWQVGGRTVHVPPDAEIYGRVGVGRTAKVKGSLQVDGSLYATEIRMKGTKRYALPELDFQGPIRSIDDIYWQVSEQTVVVSQETRVRGEPQVGRMAEIEGVPQPDGTIFALDIRIGSEETELLGPIESISETSWQVAGRAILVDADTLITGESAVGKTAQVKGSLLLDGSLYAFRIDVKARDHYKLPELDFQGTVQAMDGSSWQVGDLTVVISAQATVTGEARVGRVATMHCVVQRDGTLVATKVNVKRDRRGR